MFSSDVFMTHVSALCHHWTYNHLMQLTFSLDLSTRLILEYDFNTYITSSDVGI
jgi:hypothetical protein